MVSPSGLTSDNFASLSLWDKALDYGWHMILPIASMVVGGFAGLTMLTKTVPGPESTNNMSSQPERKVLPNDAFCTGTSSRNAMLLVIAGFPAPLSVFYLPDRC